MAMHQTALSELLNQLIAGWENEVVEFKRGKDGFSSSELGKYVSALANEANLRGKARGWLVFGVENGSRSVVGSSYKENEEHLQADKMQVLNGTGSFTFRDIHVLHHADGRVILFEIPAAPRGMPINWNGHYYGRANESLVALGQDKLDELRGQTLATDWTAQVVEGAGLEDLDPEALALARAALSGTITRIEWKEAAKDVERFLRPADLKSVDLWSERFFLAKVDKLVAASDSQAVA